MIKLVNLLQPNEEKMHITNFLFCKKIKQKNILKKVEKSIDKMKKV